MDKNFEKDFEKGFLGKKSTNPEKNSIDNDIENEETATSDIKKYMNFDNIITPSLIINLHFLCLLLSIIGVVLFIYLGIMKYKFPFGRVSCFVIAEIIPFAYLLCRLLLERLMVVFKIYEKLKRN